MDINYAKYYKPALKLCLIAGVFAVIYVSIKYFLPFFAPFVIAVVIAMINEPMIKLLEKKLKFPRKLAAVLSLLLTISILGVLITIGIVKVYEELVILKNNISNNMTDVSNQITQYIDSLTDYYNSLPEGISGAINENLKNLSASAQGIISQLISYSIDTVSSIPKMAVFIIVTLLATYFISSDRREIGSFIHKQIPQSWYRNLSGIKSDTFTAVFAYFKALMILMSITFVEVSIGLFVIRADYVLLMGLIVAISDAIPIFGTSIVMLPWIGWTLLSGNIQMALGLSIIFVLGVIIRQILEPKIVGDQIGLHPLVTLIGMYIGLSLFGVLGLFVGPVSILIVKNLQSTGIIRIWK